MIQDYGKHSCALNEPVLCQKCTDKLKWRLDAALRVCDTIERQTFFDLAPQTKEDIATARGLIVPEWLKD